MISNKKYIINNSQSTGFTVIELLVIIGIITILPTIIIANFPQIKLQFALSRAAYEFTQNARRAQEMSLSGKKYKDSNGNIQAVAGYGIYINIGTLGNKRYIIYADAAPGNQQYDLTDYTVETIDLAKTEPGIIISELRNVLGNVVSINFTPPDPVTTITLLDVGQSSIEEVFALENDQTNTKTVSINTTGLIEVK